MTVTAMAAVAVKVPEVPVIVTVTGPALGAELLAASVSTWVPAIVPALNAAVTPLGRPEAERVTAPVNPPSAVTEMMSDELSPWPMDIIGINGVSEKLGVADPYHSGSSMFPADLF